MTPLDLAAELATLRKRLEAFPADEPWVRDVRARMDRIALLGDVRNHYYPRLDEGLGKIAAEIAAEIAEREGRE